MPDINNKIWYLKHAQEEKHTEEYAQKLGLTYISLAGYPLTEEILSVIPEGFAVKYQVVPYLKIGKVVKIGAVNPTDDQAKEYLEQLTKTSGIEFKVTVISYSSFVYGISCYETTRKQKAAKEQAQKNDEKTMVEQIKDIRSASEVLKRTNTTKLLDTIVMGAMSTTASDIHLEPTETSFLVRYRVDGILQDVAVLPMPQFKQLISRIKYMGNLRMDITDQPQDGRITMQFGADSSAEKIDLRLSLMPSAWGESVVIRLLGQEKSILTLDAFGFRPDALVAIQEAISKPNGMILTSGPTGSGKSSTLYAILMYLKKPGVKIITLENPIEYRIEGVEQSQVKPGAGYEFSDGLKASLRQDPDILMVGEIRDTETAEIAVQAALTGHLLISTIHANSAPAVFARLIEIGVKPFLLSGSVNLIMAQRLVRKICPHCVEEYEPRPEIWQEVQAALVPIKNRLPESIVKILTSSTPKLKKGKGCEFCNKTGYLKRQVIIEVLVPDDTIESMIAQKSTIAEFNKAAQKQGMITMEQDGLMRALAGTTTIDEVWRVTRG